MTVTPYPTSEKKADRYAVEPKQFDELPSVVEYVTTYARQNPDVAALWCFGIGFALGWKLKPW